MLFICSLRPRRYGYYRMYSFQRNKPLDGACVGQIIESKNNEFTVGECVLGNFCSSELKKAYPEEIDLYFDNVGGKHLEATIDNMKTFGYPTW